MTTIPYNPVPGSPAQLTGPVPVQMAVGEVAQQRRVTVFFRLLMAVPHFVVLYFLGVAAGVIAFIGWWAALFTGRLPEFAQTYLAGYQLWYARVLAYLMLLTDVYPPFSLDDDPRYPLRLAIPAGERLNRAAVFFRFILVIPAGLLGAIALIGAMTIIGFIGWLIALFTGRLPASLHLAYTAVLRYQTRVNCYLYLLTAAYPGGLFGDGAAVAADPGTAGGPTEPGYVGPDYVGPDYVGPDYVGPGYTAPGYQAPGYDAPGYGTPGYGTPGYDAPGYGAAGYGVPGYAAPGGYGAPQTAGQPVDWRLLLTPGAKNLVGWFIGLGAVLWVGYIVGIVLIVASAKVVVTQNAIDTMNAAESTLSSEVTNWQSQTKACTTLDCFTAADARAAGFFSSFAATLQDTPMPPDAIAPAAQLNSDATSAARDLTELSKTTSIAQYQSTVASTGMEATLNQFDTDNNALGAALNSSR